MLIGDNNEDNANNGSIDNNGDGGHGGDRGRQEKEAQIIDFCLSALAKYN